jgi:hypothetical protein
VAAQLVASRVVLSSTEFVITARDELGDPEVGQPSVRSCPLYGLVLSVLRRGESDTRAPITPLTHIESLRSS